MTDLERRALLGDRQAQKECAKKGILLACPLCKGKASEGKRVDVGERYWWPTIYCGKCHLELVGHELWGKVTEEMRLKWNTRPAHPVGRCGECAEYDGMDCMAWPSMSENDGCTCFKPKGGK